MAFEQFMQRSFRGLDPHISIAKNGRIAFNKSASQVLSSKKVDRITLMWDADQSVIGLKPVSGHGKDDNSYIVSYDGKTGAAFVTPTLFFKWIKYSSKESLSVPFVFNEASGMVEIPVPRELINQPKKEIKRRKKAVPTDGKAPEVAQAAQA